MQNHGGCSNGHLVLLVHRSFVPDLVRPPIMGMRERNERMQCVLAHRSETHEAPFDVREICAEVLVDRASRDPAGAGDAAAWCGIQVRHCLVIPPTSLLWCTADLCGVDTSVLRLAAPFGR